MLSFPEEFFKAEEREDFLISETMKRYWACCMEIVNIIDAICQKHGLRYYADWGTLLGAVRHKGYIPWDDDMDIALKRPDYEKLLEILPNEIPECYKLSTSFNNEEHKSFWAGLSNGKHMDLSKERLNEFYGCPFVAMVDIFPLDYLPRDENDAEAVRSLFIMIWEAVQKIKDEKPEQEIEMAVKDVEDVFEIEFDRSANLRSQLWQVANQLVRSYGEEESDYLVPWCFYINRGVKFKKQWYDQSVRLPFETILLPAPSEYAQVLQAMYGDWKKRVRGAQAHEYPCFKSQLEFMRKTVEELRNK